MSATVVRQENDRESGRAEGEGEEGGRRQERTGEGEGHIYHFTAGREKQHQSWIFNKFIVPELRYTIRLTQPVGSGLDLRNPASSMTRVRWGGGRSSFQEYYCRVGRVLEGQYLSGGNDREWPGRGVVKDGIQGDVSCNLSVARGEGLSSELLRFKCIRFLPRW